MSISCEKCKMFRYEPRESIQHHWFGQLNLQIGPKNNVEKTISLFSFRIFSFALFFSPWSRKKQYEDLLHKFDRLEHDQNNQCWCFCQKQENGLNFNFSFSFVLSLDNYEVHSEHGSTEYLVGCTLGIGIITNFSMEALLTKNTVDVNEQNKSSYSLTFPRRGWGTRYPKI